MMEIIVWAIIIYLLYRFIFGVVVPVSKVTSQMQEKVRAMQEAQQRAQQEHTQTHTTAPKPENDKAGDYIDFEEIK